MQCTLLIPHLFWPPETADAAASDLELPALGTLLARSRAERFDVVPYEGWLCQAFQVERQRDWPVAPLTLAIDGGESADGYWLRADPVHLKMERDRLVLVESGLFELSEDEAQALMSTLNDHFGAESVTFFAGTPKRWYAKVPNVPKLATYCMSEVAGHDVQGFLPTGEDALTFHRVFNEAQMLLYGSPVNAEREERGEPAVNSVWFWGGGVATRVRGRPYDCVWSDDAVAVALATHADIPARNCPGDAHAILDGGGESALVVLTELASATAYHDIGEWRERLTALEKRWFEPLLRALKERRLNGLSLVTPGETSCRRFDARPRDLLKFWRNAKSWTQYA